MPLRVWVAIFFVFLLGFIGSALGVLASSFVPLGRERFTWYPKTGGAVGWAVSAVVGVVFVNLNLWLVLPATFLTGLVVSYLSTRLPRINQFLEKPKSAAATPPSAEIRANQMCFKRDWNVRPRFETEEEGLFVGRTDFLDRLNSHFISRSGGTILISGVRGVGKTSLVDRALVSSRQKLQNRYWKATWKYFEEARPWHIIDRKAWRVMLGTEGHLSPETADYLTLKKAAERYSKRPVRWWHKLMRSTAASGGCTKPHAGSYSF